MKGKAMTLEDIRLIGECLAERDRILAEIARLTEEAKQLSVSAIAEKFDCGYKTIYRIAQQNNDKTDAA